MSFAELKNQPQAVAILQRSLRAGRLGHAYLLIGTRGSGKEDLARTLAKTLNCEGKKSKGDGAFPDDCCDRCASCKKIEAQTHPDVYWIQPESKSRRILTEKIRALEKSVHMKPSEGRMKVGIIVDADRLVPNAANAFLKTLEEPPASSVLLLLTTDTQKVLPTILSRCLPLRLAPPPRGKISPVQSRVLASLTNAKNAASQSSHITAQYRILAELTALLQELRATTTEQVTTAWEVDKWDRYDKHIRENLEDELTAAIEAEYLAAREEVLTTLLSWHRDTLLTVEGAATELLMFPDYAATLRQQTDGLDRRQAAANLEVVEKIRAHLEQNINESLALEVGLLQLNR